MVFIVQIGNVVPLVFTLIPNKPHLKWSMVLVLCIGVSSLICLAVSWDHTYVFFGEKRSVMLYIGTFLAAGADCLSNVVFWPYVGQFQRSYITAMGTGESLSSAVSAIVSSSQKAIGFSPSVFFVVLLGIVLLCSLAFLVLETKYAESLARDAKSKAVSLATLPTISALSEECCSDQTSIPPQAGWKAEIPTLAIIASIAFVQNALNLSLLPLACKGYKNAHWISQNAMFIAAPVMSISASFFQPKKSMIPAVCCWIATSVFIIVAASMTSPVIADESTGTGVMAAVAILSGASLSYSKVSAMLLLRSKQPAESGYNKEFTQKLLTAAGVSMQIGSIVGAVSMFLLVQVAGVFPK